MKFAKAKSLLSESDEEKYCAEILRLPELIEGILKTDSALKELAKSYADSENVFFIGRGLDYAISLEGSLKLKEISYIHSEAYAAGELKHGTISLIEDKTPVFAVATQSDLNEKTLGNIKEVKARGARVIALVGENHSAADEFADDIIRLPEISDFLMPSLAVVPLQIFAYYMALGRGCDVDKPRNLAKSVTVE